MEKHKGFSYEVNNHGTLIIYSGDDILAVADKCNNMSTEQANSFVDDFLKSINLLDKYQHLFNK